MKKIIIKLFEKESLDSLCKLMENELYNKNIKDKIVFKLNLKEVYFPSVLIADYKDGILTFSSENRNKSCLMEEFKYKDGSIYLCEEKELIELSESKEELEESEYDSIEIANKKFIKFTEQFSKKYKKRPNFKQTNVLETLMEEFPDIYKLCLSQANINLNKESEKVEEESDPFSDVFELLLKSQSKED